MPALSLVAAARPVALYTPSPSLLARSAQLQASRRTWGSSWQQPWRAVATRASGDGSAQNGVLLSFGGSSASIGGDQRPGSRCSSSGSSSGSSNDSADAVGVKPLQAAQGGRSRTVLPLPGMEARLAELAEQYGCSKAALSNAVAALGKIHQARFVKHSCNVAAWLRSQGVEEAQLRRMLLRCPLAFSWPVEERAGVLFGQLQGLGLTAAEAALCFERQPIAINSPSSEHAISVLAELFAAGGKSSRPAEQLVGSFLRQYPTAVIFLVFTSKTLHERIDNLLALGLTRKQLVAATMRHWALLAKHPNRLAALEAALQQELGVGRQLFAKLLHTRPRLASYSVDRVQARSEALVQVFGCPEALHMVGRAPDLLVIGSSVWQTALEVMQLCRLTRDDALGVGRSNPNVLCRNWLAVGPLANRLALQHCLQLTAGQVFKQYAWYAANYSARRVAGRLLFLQHHGLLHLLVADKRQWQREWRTQHGQPRTKRAQGEPQLLSVGDVAVLTDAQLASLPPVASAGGLPVLRAFIAELQSSPAWLELQAAAAAEGARLLALLPKQLREAAQERGQATGQGEEEE